MRGNLLLLTLICSACSAPPTTPEQVDRVAGQKIYVMVATTEDISDDSILASQACIKRDALCMSLRQQAKQVQVATVSVYDTFMFSKVVVPRSASLKYGDIIQVDVAKDPKKPSVFVTIGATASKRDAGCDWVDGSVLLRKGGVRCNGWSYTSLK